MHHHTVNEAPLLHWHHQIHKLARQAERHQLRHGQKLTDGKDSQKKARIRKQKVRNLVTEGLQACCFFFSFFSSLETSFVTEVKWCSLVEQSHTVPSQLCL